MISLARVQCKCLCVRVLCVHVCACACILAQRVKKTMAGLIGVLTSVCKLSDFQSYASVSPWILWKIIVHRPKPISLQSFLHGFLYCGTIRSIEAAFFPFAFPRLWLARFILLSMPYFSRGGTLRPKKGMVFKCLQGMLAPIGRFQNQHQYPKQVSWGTAGWVGLNTISATAWNLLFRQPVCWIWQPTAPNHMIFGGMEFL